MLDSVGLSTALIRWKVEQRKEKIDGRRKREGVSLKRHRDVRKVLGLQSEFTIENYFKKKQKL